MQNFLFTSDIFRGSRYEKGHPLDMDRVWPSVELLRLMGWINEDQIIKNSPAEITELIKFHDLEYVKALKNPFQDLSGELSFNNFRQQISDYVDTFNEGITV